MLYQIIDGTVTLGGEAVLSHINFEIHGTEKIAVVGRNGAGKTTLLNVIAGELLLDRDDKRQGSGQGSGVSKARNLTIGMLCQQTFPDSSKTVEEELLEACPCPDTFDRERFAYEQEYDRLFTGFGFAKKDKKKRLEEFSGGEQTRIALIRLLLQKPDILLLDEPTNHLDFQMAEWLEQYMKSYEKAVVMVSHDRFFLDQTAEVVYELEDGKLVRYPGNYSHYRKQKLKNIQLQEKAYQHQQEEIARLEDLITRFKNKPKKAAFARSRQKILDRMEKIEKPKSDEAHLFTGEIQPEFPGSKWVFESEHLKIGYEKALLEITMRIRRGQKIGILGPNGAGKTTFLKTIAGLIPPVEGKFSIGNQIIMGYFDQHSAKVDETDPAALKTVTDHFHNLFPAMTEKEVRSVLGAYLFGGKEASKQVKSLSGGERSRLILAELLQSRPNFLILDEPANHMDIPARETLESAFQAYKGTMLFVSHDRYFLHQVADAMLIFDQQAVMYYPFGYSHYVERRRKQAQGQTISEQIRAEEQALIAGMRAVPKAERHRLREIPVQEAYADWKLRLALEPAEEARLTFEKVVEEREKIWQQLVESPEFWDLEKVGDNKMEIASSHTEESDNHDRKKYLSRLEQLFEEEEACHRRWTSCCLEWYDTLLEVEDAAVRRNPGLSGCQKGEPVL